MKDDFYKDIEHKRASKEADEKNGGQSKEETKPTMKRSDRHRPKPEKEKNEKKKVGNKEKNGDKRPKEDKAGAFSNFGQKFSTYFNRENLDKGKVFFAGKFSSYNKRFREELKVSREKVSELGASKKTAGQEKGQEKEGKSKSSLPVIIGSILILPVTIILAVMIISNFWPTGGDGTELAGDNLQEETAEEAGDEDVNPELEEQKAEMEREVAESREEDSGDSEAGNDLGTGEIEFDYSADEQAELEDAATAAISDKESAEESDEGSDGTAESGTDETDVTPSSEEETQEEQSEESTEASETEESTEESDGGSSHVVSGEDNLYRIAIRYYGSGSPENVEKIRDANSISGNSLSVGQELVIPE